MSRKRDGITALIAGADTPEADLATILLEESDLSVERCADPADLFRRLEANADNVVLIFADLAGISGQDLARVRQRWPKIRLVTTTARRESLPFKADRTLLKPWRPLDLLVAAEAVRAGGAPGAGRRG